MNPLDAGGDRRGPAVQGAGFTFVEVLTMCPTGWFLPTADGPDYLEGTFEQTYPLGALKEPEASR